MRKETEEYLRMWLNTLSLTDFKKHSELYLRVQELFLDWERLRDIVGSLNVPEKQEPGDRLTSEGVYE